MEFTIGTGEEPKSCGETIAAQQRAVPFMLIISSWQFPTRQQGVVCARNVVGLTAFKSSRPCSYSGRGYPFIRANPASIHGRVFLLHGGYKLRSGGAIVRACSANNRKKKRAELTTTGTGKRSTTSSAPSKMIGSIQTPAAPFTNKLVIATLTLN